MKQAEIRYGVIFLRTAQRPACYSQASTTLNESREGGFREVESWEEVGKQILGGWIGIVAAVVSNTTELTAVLGFLAIQQNAIRRAGTLRVLIFNTLAHPKVPGLLMSKGCAEVLEMKLNSRAFLHKIHRFDQIIQRNASNASNASHDPGERASASDESAAPATGSDRSGRPDKSRGPQKSRKEGVKRFSFSPPLGANVPDFWILRQPSDVRVVLDRWLIEFIGPPPSCGEWEALTSDAASGGKPRWKWVARAGMEKFNGPRGYWVFQGRLPEFIWKLNRWRFVSDRPLFAWCEAGNAPSHRASESSPGSLLLASNSPQALGKLPEIMEALVTELRFKNEPTDSVEEDLRIAKDEDISRGWNDAVSADEEAADWSDSRKKEDEVAADWNDGVSADESSPEWNDGLAPDEKPADWSDHGATRDNVFNSGRGLGQGQSSDHAAVGYEQEEFSSGAEAFAPMGIDATLDGKNVHLIEEGNGWVKFGVEDDGSTLRKGEWMRLSVSMNGFDAGDDSEMALEGKLSQVEITDDGRPIGHLQLDPSSAARIVLLHKRMQVRQEQILRFFKAVKGA